MTVNSSTDIGNLALDLLSSGVVTDIENPTSSTESLLNRHYTLVRRRVLREHPWNFATKRAQLAANATAPVFGFEKQFTLPGDFVRLLMITDSSLENEYPMGSRAFRVENGNILINTEFFSDNTLNIVYIYDFTNVSQMDPLFVDLLVAELAMSISFKVTESTQDIQRLQDLLKQKRQMAYAIDGQEAPPIVIQRSKNKHVRNNNNSTRDTHRVIF